MQKLNGRRGAVFSVRVTEDERQLLERMQGEDGPRSLGPWLLWRALRGETPEVGEVLPARAGTTPTSAAARHYRAGAVLPGPGTTRARVLPRCRGTTAAEVLPARSRLVLDLCAGSGSWSAPYEEAGYRVRRVTLPELDVRTWKPPSEPVWGVLAAPPCDQFSLARNGHKASPRDFVRGMACVNACLRIIHQVAPRWWALENPVGLLSKWLGTPRDVFDPCDFGDPWTTRTALWGWFRVARRGPFVRPIGGGPLCSLCDPERRKTTWCSNAAHRAITPAGFAQAFFEANP